MLYIVTIVLCGGVYVNLCGGNGNQRKETPKSSTEIILCYITIIIPTNIILNKFKKNTLFQHALDSQWFLYIIKENTIIIID